MPGVYISWKVANPDVIGTQGDFKVFQSRQKAVECVTQQPIKVNRFYPLRILSYDTDGFASLATASARWEVVITRDLKTPPPPSGSNGNRVHGS